MSETLDSFKGRETLAIITGANGAIGKAYLEKLSSMPDIRSVGITREQQTDIPGVEYRHGVDLLEEHKVREAIASLCCKQAEKILLIHPVGKFKFEVQPTQEIDAEVLLSNMNTMVNVVRAVISNMRGSSLVICGFGSISDKYNVPFWQSYTEAKNRLRESLQTLSTMFSLSDHRVRSVIVNVSSTNTGNENQLRPAADKRYWLEPSKIVEATLPLLLNDSKASYQEVDVFEPDPNFDADAYYSDPTKILEKWSKEMRQSLE